MTSPSGDSDTPRGAGRSRKRRGRSALAALGCVGLYSCMLCACDGTLTGSPAFEQETPGADTPVDPSNVAPVPRARFARLTHAQWENSVRDLLFLPEPSGLSATFPTDPRSAGFAFDNNDSALQADQALTSAYARAAETLAEQVTNSSAALTRILPETATSDRAGARELILQFGERAFRRPLGTSEVDAFVALYDRGGDLYDDASGFIAGVRIVLEAFLQSPHFLYRIESSTQPGDGGIDLSGWEVAQRLSYFLWNSTPDAALLEAARSGVLDSTVGVRQQAFRLLASPPARPALVRFHEQLLELSKVVGVAPSPAAFPNVSPDFGRVALESGERFIEHLAFNELGSFADLMTSSLVFVNDELADVYAAEGSFGSELLPVELPAGSRAGVLGQVGFLAANATSLHPDPIHRGVFVATRVLCRTIAAPPDGVPPLPPIAGGTNRQIVENHTQSSPVCRACHEELINPFGFAFEEYDATGAYRSIDNGFPVDSSVSPILDGERIELSGSVDLAHALAASKEAHDCFASHLVQFALGRRTGPADAALVAQLSEASRAGTSIAELMVALSQSPALTSRSREELP